MELIIEQFHRTSDSLDGVLKIAGEKVCDCAQHAPTALAIGTYNVVIHTCKHYRRKMPCILLKPPEALKQACSYCPKCESVSNNSNLPIFCPQIKIGNGVHGRTDGSIIIGEHITWGCMKHPKEYFDRLIDRLDKAQNRGETITLTIKG